MRRAQLIVVGCACALVQTCRSEPEPISFANVKGSTNFDGDFFGRFPQELNKDAKKTVMSMDLRRPALSGNGVYGNLPTQIGQFQKLTTMVIHENEMTGTLPTQIGSLAQSLSERLEVWGNPKMGGEVPTEVGNLQALTGSFVLEGPSRLEGPLPTEVGRLSQLEERLIVALPRRRKGEADTTATGLTGTLPTEIGMLLELQELNLEGHEITGELPTEVGLLSNLQRGFVLLDNRLGGTMPTQLGKLSRLKVHLLLTRKLRRRVLALFPVRCVTCELSAHLATRRVVSVFRIIAGTF